MEKDTVIRHAINEYLSQENGEEKSKKTQDYKKVYIILKKSWYEENTFFTWSPFGRVFFDSKNDAKNFMGSEHKDMKYEEDWIAVSFTHSDALYDEHYYHNYLGFDEDV